MLKNFFRQSLDMGGSSHCEGCRLMGAGPEALRRLIAVITQRNVIVKILAHLELETDPAPMQPARAPPQLELAF